MKRSRAYTFQFVGAILSAAMLLVGAHHEPVFAQTAEATAVPAYIVVQLQIKDKEAFFNKYAPAAGPTIQAHQGRGLVGSSSPEILEGQWANNWTVVLEFPSVQAAKSWYNSAAYQKAIPFRKAATEFTNMVLVEGFTGLPPTPGSMSK